MVQVQETGKAKWYARVTKSHNGSMTSLRSQAMVEALAHVLGNACRLTSLCRCCAWNVMGPGALSAAALFKSQAADLFAAQELVGERIVHLGGCAIPDDDDRIAVAPPSVVGDGETTPAVLLDLVIAGHEGAILSLEAASDVARDNEDHATSALLAERLLAHLRHRHALRRCL